LLKIKPFHLGIIIAILILLFACHRDPFDGGNVLPPPYFTPSSMPFTEPFLLEISHELQYDNPVKIWYTFNELTPPELYTLYAGPILIDTTRTVFAYAYLHHYGYSNTVSVNFTLHKVGNPTFSLPPDAYYTQQTLKIIAAAPEDTIYYTLDGNEPFQHTAYRYTTPLFLPPPFLHNVLVKAKAYQYGWLPSDTVVGFYEFKMPMMLTVPATIPGNLFRPNLNYSVHLSEFLMGNYPVTQLEYLQTMTENRNGVNESPSQLASGDYYPVENVSWYEAIVYCNRRSQQEGLEGCYNLLGSTNTDYWGEVPNTNSELWNSVTLDITKNGYRLPTEMEWMYAANGGVGNLLYTYSGSFTIDDVAWYNANSEGTTQPVGTKNGNQLGLFDMSGNVWEWCWDWHYHSYPTGIQTDPQGPPSASSEGYFRIMRGGSSLFDETGAKIEFRGRGNPHYRQNDHGFRVVRRLVTGDR